LLQAFSFDFNWFLLLFLSFSSVFVRAPPSPNRPHVIVNVIVIVKGNAGATPDPTAAPASPPPNRAHVIVKVKGNGRPST